jgi:hypothetical protein
MSLIVVSREGWSLHDRTGHVEGVEAVLARVKGRKVVVAFASELCFAGVINAGGTSREQLYRLEEQLPVAAEELSAAFIAGQDSVLGVAVLTHDLRETLSRLVHCRVSAVCPLALLAAAQAGDGKHRFGQDEIEITSGRPTSWTWGLQPTSGPSDAAAREALEIAEKIIDGKARPPLDLRDQSKSTFASRSGLLALSAIAALLLVTCALWVRAWRYDAVAASLEAEEQQVYQSIFAGEAPADIVARLESEARRLSGSPVSKVPERPVASAVLVDLLGALPASIKLEVAELRWEGSPESSSFVLTGRTTSHRDAESIATALRNASQATGQGAPFAIGAPGTEQLPDGSVTFSISGTQKPPRQAGGAQ